MKVAVMDTSALVRLFVPDGPLPAGLEAMVEGAWRAESVLLMPELALAEAGQVLVKKERARALGAEEVDAILDAILSLPVTWVGHAGITARALGLSRSLSVSVYDAIFLALAIERGCDLITADDGMSKAMLRARKLGGASPRS